MADTLSRLQVMDNIQQILWGKSFADVNDGNGEDHTFILRSLTIKESNFLNFLYNHELKYAQQEGILSYEQMKCLLEAQGVWTQADVEEIKELKLKKNRIKNQIKDAEFATTRKKNLNKALEQVEDQIKDLKTTEISLFLYTSEQRAEEYKRRHMVMLFTEDFNEQPYWSTQENFMKSTDALLLSNLTLAYFKNNLYNEKTLRQMARSSDWRFRWVAAKHGENLFGKSISEWSEMQNMLVYWSEYYDSIYESMERPADHIIEDDNACDSWMKEQNKKHSQGSNTDSNKNIYGHKRAKQNLDHSEHFIMVPRGDKEAIDKVQEMNAERVRDKLRKEYEQIKKVKDGGRRIKEWNLGNRRVETQVNVTRKGR